MKRKKYLKPEILLIALDREKELLGKSTETDEGLGKDTDFDDEDNGEEEGGILRRFISSPFAPEPEYEEEE